MQIDHVLKMYLFTILSHFFKLNYNEFFDNYETK